MIQKVMNYAACPEKTGGVFSQRSGKTPKMRSIYDNPRAETEATVLQGERIQFCLNLLKQGLKRFTFARNCDIIATT